MLSLRTICAIIIVPGILLTSSFQSSYNKDFFTGTWDWSKIKSSDSEEWKAVDEMFLGLVSNLRTEFRDDLSYSEYKNKVNSESVSEIKGEWKFKGDSLFLKRNDKEWKFTEVYKLTSDTLILETGNQAQLLMTKRR